MITTKKTVEIDRDGTGYKLTVKKNFESYARKLKDMAKAGLAEVAVASDHLCLAGSEI